MFYHIILTEKCDSKCKYCYEKSMNEFENKISKKWRFENCPIDSDVNIEKLKKFLKQDKDANVIFYGGEPLLQLEKIKKIMDNIESKFYLQTNGKLLYKIPKNYLKRFEKILVSIDGKKERTDETRGDGTYEKVIENVKKIRDNGFDGEIVARMTIIYPDIFEQVKHLVDLGIFDSAHWQIDAGFYEFDFNECKFFEFADKYKKQIRDLLDYWISEMRRGKVLKFYPFFGIFESLYYEMKTKLRCGSGYANYTITTNGKISACPIMNSVEDFYCGNLNSKINDLKKIHCGKPCTDCKYYGICGGRCLYSNYAKLWSPKGEKLICSTIIHLIEELKKRIPQIKKLIEKKVIEEKDFEYLKYFGPEIIP